MPPPTPVPRMTPNTVPNPAAAPSVASDSAKQLASLAKRTSRPSAASTSRASVRPISQVELAFLTSPVRGDDRSRNADPDRGAGSDLVFERRDETGDCRDGRGVIARGRGHAARGGDSCRLRRSRPPRSWCRRGRCRCGSPPARLSVSRSSPFARRLSRFGLRQHGPSVDGSDAYRLLTRSQHNASVKRGRAHFRPCGSELFRAEQATGRHDAERRHRPRARRARC